MSRLLVVLAIAAFGLAACGEREQEATGERTYQGKRDAKPWDSEPLAAEYRGGKWSKGNRESWEDAIKSRQLAQHEHKRIYQ